MVAQVKVEHPVCSITVFVLCVYWKPGWQCLTRKWKMKVLNRVTLQHGYFVSFFFSFWQFIVYHSLSSFFSFLSVLQSILLVPFVMVLIFCFLRWVTTQFGNFFTDYFLWVKVSNKLWNDLKITVGTLWQIVSLLKFVSWQSENCKFRYRKLPF